MNDRVKIKFLGGAHTVTGSKTLLQSDKDAVLVDCGLFQGLKELRELNWKPLPYPAKNIQTILITHGHLDHIGYLPRIVKEGFRGRIHCTAPTKDIAWEILEDSASLLEKEAALANRDGYSKHTPSLPLYTQDDVNKTMPHFVTHKCDEWISLGENLKFKFLKSGHILGSAFLEVEFHNKRIVFSGDLGRQKPWILEPPQAIQEADFLILESTYGNRFHPTTSPYDELTEIVNKVIAKQGTLLIPSFVLERAQEVLVILSELMQQGKIPSVPIYLDSPMGVDITALFAKYSSWHKLSTQQIVGMLKTARLIKNYSETLKIIEQKESKIVIAGSGMITGGRILSYLEKYLADPSALVLLVGYQAEGTRGRSLENGARELKFLGKYFPVKAQVAEISSMSGHADQNETLAWLKNFSSPPIKTFLNHGEPDALDALRVKIKDTFGWDCEIPRMNEEYTLEMPIKIKY